MNKPEIVIVSPHRDDAAFSCGILMCATLMGVNITLVNVFTLSAYAPFSPQAERGGVGTVAELRRQEDLNMIVALRAVLPGDLGNSTVQVSEVNLGLLDAPLRLKVNVSKVQGQILDALDFEDEVTSLIRIMSPSVEKASYFLLPLGLGGTGLEGHIDHRIAREAGMRCTTLDRIAFYEDLPYAARMTDLLRSSAVSAFAPVAQRLSQPYTARHRDGVSIKAILAGQYPSQIDSGTIQEMCDYAKDRGGGEVVYAGAKIRSLLEASSRRKFPSAGAQ